jgi:hypothetical protein
MFCAFWRGLFTQNRKGCQQLFPSSFSFTQKN